MVGQNDAKVLTNSILFLSENRQLGNRQDRRERERERMNEGGLVVPAFDRGTRESL